MIVTGTASPWGHAKVAGVRNVIVNGGIIALGHRLLPGEPVPAGAPVGWLLVRPDINLLNGSVFPPAVPNIIDVRILQFPVQVAGKE